MENIQIRERREGKVDKPVTFYFGSTSENTNITRCESPTSENTFPSLFESWNESAMLSCWNSVHGLTEEVNKATESGSKGFLRSFSFTANNRQSEILRTLSCANIRPVSELSGSGSNFVNSPVNGFQRSVSCIDHRDNQGDKRSNSLASDKCKKHAKLSNPGRNCQKRASGNFRYQPSNRYSLSSLAEEATPRSPKDSQKRSLGSGPREMNNNYKRRSCEPHSDRCHVSGNEGFETRNNSEQEIPVKNPAYRQRSCPGLRERTLMQVESKRHSMPLPLIYKKEMMNKVILSQNKTSDHVVEITDTVR